MASINAMAARRHAAINHLAASSDTLIELLGLDIKAPHYVKDQEMAAIQRTEYSAQVLEATVAAVQAKSATSDTVTPADDDAAPDDTKPAKKAKK